MFMRNASAGIAILLLAGAAAAHGVHDLRGDIRIGGQRIRVEIVQSNAHSENRRCLRLLGDLQVRDETGKRLVGTEHEDEDRCRLEYAVASGTTELTLQLRPSGRARLRNERLILQPSRDGTAYRDAIVLTSRGNVETLVLSALAP
jgi:hypothetical protein